MFVAMWGCLFSEVAGSIKAAEHDIIALLQSDACYEAVLQHKKEHGIPPHPYVLVKSFGPKDTWPI